MLKTRPLGRVRGVGRVGVEAGGRALQEGPVIRVEEIPTVEIYAGFALACRVGPGLVIQNPGRGVPANHVEETAIESHQLAEATQQSPSKPRSIRLVEQAFIEVD